MLSADHVPPDWPAGVDAGGDVGRKQVLPQPGGDLGDRRGREAADRVDEDVEPAEFGYRPLGHLLHRRFLAQVDVIGAGARAPASDHLEGLVCGQDVRDPDPDPLVRQRHRDRLADPGRRSGDERAHAS